MVEKVDRVLQFLEHVLMPLALTRDIGDAPQRRPLEPIAFDRTHLDPVPSDRGLAIQGRRQPDLLHGALVVARRLREAVHRLGDLGRAGEQPFDRPQMGHVRRTRHRHIGFVRI